MMVAQVSLKLFRGLGEGLRCPVVPTFRQSKTEGALQLRGCVALRISMIGPIPAPHDGAALMVLCCSI